MREIEQLLKRLHSFGLLTHDEEVLYPEALLNIETQLSVKTDYIKFIEEFNKITGKKYKPDVESRGLFYENEAIYSLGERCNAVKNSLTDPWVNDNLGIVTPKWILNAEKTAKYINYVAPSATTNNKKPGAKQSATTVERKAAV
jgi:hypothetical protein